VWGLAPAILDGQRKGRRRRRLSPHGDARWTSAKRQGGPDPPETKVGVSFLNSAYPFCGTMIREQLAIATVAFAISFVAITEVSGAKRAAADIEGHSAAAKFGQPGRLSGNGERA
jgi:hypothetical protein